MKRKTGKKIWLIVTIPILVLAILIIIIANIMSPNFKAVPIEIADVDLANVTDGTYEGTAENGLVKVKVSVTVADAVITDIKILEHDNGLGKKAEVITERVLEAQSLEVDAVSSATYSSMTILKAIENALGK